MSHGIMVCDVPLYRDLTKVNVHAYLASKLVWVDTLAKMELLISLDQTYEFVISLAVLDRVDITEKVIALKQKYLPRVPIIIIGHLNTPNENVGCVPSAFDQAGIVKYIIKQLKWTPTEYNSRKIDEYIPVPISLIEYTNIAVEDLYLLRPEKNLNEYVLAANKGEELKELLPTWKKLEITNVFVSSAKRFAAVVEITKSTIAATNEAINSTDEKVQQKVLSKNTEFFAEIFSDPAQFDNISTDVKEQISILAQKTNTLIGKLLTKVPAPSNPTLAALVSSFRSNEQSYIPQLSFLSTYVSLQMMKHESWFNDAVEEKVRYLHFFNNLVLAPLYKKHPDYPKDKNIFYYYPKLNDKEKELFRWHPKISSNLVSAIPNMPVGLDQLVLQHHGNINGDLQNTVLQDDLSLLAKYCFIAELFSESILDSELEMNDTSKMEIIQKIKNRVTLRSYVKIITVLEGIKI